MINIAITPEYRVRASITFDMAMSTRQAWGQMRDFPHFITQDPLHRRVRDFDRASRSMIIEHRFLGIGPNRRSRILKWEEGVGYAFSDLSMRGNAVGFPHVCAYHLEPIDDARCRLTFSANGRWTSRWVPRVVVRLWLWWVLVATCMSIRQGTRSLPTSASTTGPQP